MKTTSFCDIPKEEGFVNGGEYEITDTNITEAIKLRNCIIHAPNLKICCDVELYDVAIFDAQFLGYIVGNLGLQFSSRFIADALLNVSDYTFVGEGCIFNALNLVAKKERFLTNNSHKITIKGIE